MSYGQPPYGSPPPPPGGGEPPYGSGEQPPYQPYGAAGQPPYGPPGAPGYGGPQQPQTSVMAILGLVFGIVGLVTSCFCYGFLGIPGIVLGFLGMKEVKESNGAKTGHGMALAGLITGIAAVAIGILLVVLVFALNVFDPTLYE